MRIISVDSIKGNELLAKDIINNSNSVLMPAGMIMKKEYVNRLKDLEIEYIYVEDDIAQGINLADSIEFQIKEQCQGAIRDILHRYSYHYEEELKEIKYVAENILNDILNQPEVIFNLSGIRNKRESSYLHSLNVCALSVIIALRLKIKKEITREIAIGCLLHDIGYTYKSMDYKNLKVETCSEKELREIRKHVIYGYSAVEKANWLSQIAKDIIISHHERLDGSGYPFHLTSDRIRIGSKIAAVCDEFDSKVYGNLTIKMKVHDVIDYIVSQADIKFDIEVVRAFVASVAAYPIGTIVVTNQNEKGIVLRQNPKCPTRPVIRIIEDSQGFPMKRWVERDLTRELTLFITDTILE